MAGIIYEYEIPNPDRMAPLDERSLMGPSGELMTFIPKPLTEDKVVEREITKISVNIGTYGMGGPGFFGCELGKEWLVVAIWGASDWIHVNERLITDISYVEHQRKKPWITNEGDTLAEFVVGQRIVSVKINQFSLKLILNNGFAMVIEEAPESRPVLQGSKEQREFKVSDDLRRAVFLSPTTEIWV